MRLPSKIALDFIAAHEAFRGSAYQDSAGVWTIGFGHIAGVKQGDTCTEAQARQWLAGEVISKGAAPLCDRIGSIADELTENQYSALISFVYNVGAGVGWTIWKRLRARQFDQIPGELIKFVNAGGKKVQGLVNRRADEIKLWSTDEPGSTPESPPSAETRVAVTPPTPADPTPPGKSGQIIAGAIAVAGTVPAAAKTVVDTLTPWQEAAPWLAHAIAAVGVVGAAAAVAVLVFNWLKKREARG